MIGASSFITVLALSHSMLFASDPVINDFESDQTGSFPGGSWVDIQERVINNPTPAPTMLVVETTGPDGNPTHAAQSGIATGTNGMFIPIEDSPVHRFEIDLRVDSPIQANSWAMAVGLIQDIGEEDVNLNTQAVVYTWSDRRMYLFVTQGFDVPGTVNLRMPNFLYNVGVWYKIIIEADGREGVITATVNNAETGEQLSTRTYNASQWIVDRGRFDAYGVFDGEAMAATTGMQATVDNVFYEADANCPADYTADGELNFLDVSAFLAAYSSQDLSADLFPDGTLNFFDVSFFLDMYNAGCP
ncbi:MAG: GC-type dockerin domain-anchored protein [Phycisphaerales bacterium]